MLSIKLFGLLAISTPVATSTLTTRDAGTDLIITDLLRLDRAIRIITDAAGNYSGGAEGYRAIQNVKDSNAIIAIVSNPITPDIRDAVNALIVKKYLIDAASFSKETANGLNLISYDHDTLILVAVAPKLALATIPAATVPVLAIDLTEKLNLAVGKSVKKKIAAIRFRINMDGEMRQTDQSG
ncbi:hypothetical protein BKA65DRAFT_553112 [Rhexocercosporidium sp. MPI-PUGE-AT-0058]|nr:hypothetical protein BKA65DRAFT_553112 [Rhexocercosporidium sp. MPI-PUGE-AT-0058]